MSFREIAFATAATFAGAVAWKVLPRFFGAAKKWRNQSVAPLLAAHRQRVVELAEDVRVRGVRPQAARLRRVAAHAARLQLDAAAPGEQRRCAPAVARTARERRACRAMPSGTSRRG